MKNRCSKNFVSKQESRKYFGVLIMILFFSPAKSLEVNNRDESCLRISFFGDTSRDVDGFDGLKKFYLEILKYSNILWIDEYRLAQKIDVLNEIKNEGSVYSVILMPYWTFFKENLTLNSDFRNRWDSVLFQVKRLESGVLGVYLADEPISRGLKSGMSKEMTLDVLKLLLDMVKDDLPDSEYWVIESHNNIESHALLSKLFDVVGYNCYGFVENCGRKIDGSGASILEIYEKANASDDFTDVDTSLLLVPGIFLSTAKPEITEDNLLAIADDYVHGQGSIASISNFSFFLYNSYTRESGEVITGIEHLSKAKEFLSDTMNSYACSEVK